MRGSTVAVLAWVMASVLGSDAAAAEGEVRHVLARRDAPVFVAPTEAAAHAVDAWGGRWDVRLSPFWTWRLVAEREDGWVEVAPAGEADPACHDRARGLDGLTLRLFVRRADLAAVTTREVVAEGSGEHAVTLHAGVGLQRARADGPFKVVREGYELTVSLPDDAVGWWYSPRDRRAPVRSERALRYGTRLSLGEATLVVEAVTAKELQRWKGGDLPDGPAPRVVDAALARDGGSWRARFDDGCVRFETEVAAKAVVDRSKVDPGGAIVGYGTPVAKAPPGTAVLLPGGERVGQTLRARYYHQAPQRRGELSCFPHALRPLWSTVAESSTLTLCHRTLDLEPVTP